MRGMSCPRCGKALELWSELEGGWCPKCKEWYPADIVDDWEEEND
jgi:uncharacterized protein YbaR (Trm112 family)